MLGIQRFERCVRRVTSHLIRRSRLFSHCAEIGAIDPVKKIIIRVVCGFCVIFTGDNEDLTKYNWVYLKKLKLVTTEQFLVGIGIKFEFKSCLRSVEFNVCGC